eukprot:g5453.t1
MPSGQPLPSSESSTGPQANRPGFLALVSSAPWINRSQRDDAFARQHQQDRVGVRLQWLFITGGLVAFTTTTSATEIALAPALVYSFIRLNNTWRTYASCLLQPALCLSIAFAFWGALSLLWSPDAAHGLDELAMARVLGIWVILWPLIEYRRWFIGALCVGFLVGNTIQLLHAVGVALDLPVIQWNRHLGRNSGWWDPVVGGTLLTGALGLHLPAALMGSGRWRVMGVAGCVVTGMGILATGTRGAWIASAALVFIALIVAGAHELRHRWSGPRTLWAGLVVIVLTLALGWLVAGNQVQSRFSEAREELTRASEGDYDTFTGARLMMGRWGVDAFRREPIAGVGLGGYAASVRAQLETEGQDPDAQPVHDHAHNTLIQIGATTGIVGVLLALGVLVISLTSGFRVAPGERFASYDSGPAFALVGLSLAGGFDVIHLNSQTGALLGVLIVLCAGARPALRTGDPMTCPVSDIRLDDRHQGLLDDVVPPRDLDDDPRAVEEHRPA